MGEYICTQCHYVGMPKQKKRGSSSVEKFCWFIFPFGIPYTLWRMLTKIKSCRHCGEPVVPVNSAEGKRLMEIERAALGPPATLKPKSEPLPPTPRVPHPEQDPNVW